MTYSAFGYGNETVLCNDPHLTPWTDLDNTEVNQQAERKSNTSVRECRIGPWVFPIQVTKDFLPKGLSHTACYQNLCAGPRTVSFATGTHFNSFNVVVIVCLNY